MNLCHVFLVFESSHLPNIVKLINNDNDELKYESSIIITNIIHSNKISIKKLIKIGAIQPILNFLDDDNNKSIKLKKIALKLIYNISTYHSNDVLDIIQYKINNQYLLNKLYDLFKKNEFKLNKLYLTTITSIIGAISFKSPNQKKKIDLMRELNIFKLLVNIINNNNKDDNNKEEELIYNSINVIREAALYGTRSQIKYLVTVKSLPAICSFLDIIKKKPNSSIQPILHCMENILNGNRYHYASYIEIYGGLDSLEELYLNGRCKTLIDNMLIKYFGYESNNQLIDTYN